MKHAVLNPSGAHRHMRCAGSPVLEALCPRTSSVYADEGTAAHRVASWCLADKKEAVDFLGTEIVVGEHRFVVDKEMAGYVQEFVDYVRRLAVGRQLFVDQKVPIGHITGEEGAEGTADAIIIDAAQRMLWSIDFKYGIGERIYVKGNEQTGMYGLGSLHKFALLCEFDKICMVIHQPRIDHVDEEIVSVADLLLFGGEAADAAVKSREALILGAAGITPEELFKAGFLVPGDKQCRFCDAKAICPALRAEVMEVTTGRADAADFADLIEVGPMTGDNYLSMAMGSIDRIEQWAAAIRAEVERRLLQGKLVPGYKLVEGRRGNRAWSDAEKAEELLRASELGDAEIYKPRELISPTAAEKLLKKPKPERWKIVEAATHRADGKPSVAEAEDPRPALTITPVAEEFRALAKE